MAGRVPVPWRRGCERRTVLTVGLLLSLLAGPRVVAAQVGRVWQRDDRVLVTAFSEIFALAKGPRHVFAATPHGVLAYDFAFRRWEPPLTAADGYPAAERPTALAYDPAGGLLWLGTARGSLYSLTVGIDRWERLSGTGGAAVLEIVPYRPESTLYAATAGGWLAVRPGSFIADRVPSSRVPEPVRREVENAHRRQDPFLDAARATLGLDPGMRRWPITDVETGERPGEYWIATLGGGLVSYDSRFRRSEWLPYGTLTRGAGAIAITDGRIWLGGDGGGPRDGVTLTDTQLQQWRQLESGTAGAPAGAVRDILVTGDTVWFAAADGLYRLDARNMQAGRFERITTRDGLPSDAVTALAAGPDGVWVGTTRGLGPGPLARPVSGVATNSHAGTLLPGVRINGLATSGDTLWVASDEGLFIVAPGGGVAPAPGAPARGRFLDVVAAEDGIYAVAEQGYYRHAAGSWSGPERAAFDRLGRLGRAAAAAGALWISGEKGAARLDLETRAWRYYLGGTDLPRGPIRDVVPAGDDVWLATPAGAFRFRWRQ